tara:strand:+ start:38 stop:319 length:282 start_codon:yes stop_codon:yes gene_type:complete
LSLLDDNVEQSIQCPTKIESSVPGTGLGTGDAAGIQPHLKEEFKVLLGVVAPGSTNGYGVPPFEGGNGDDADEPMRRVQADSLVWRSGDVQDG